MCDLGASETSALFNSILIFEVLNKSRAVLNCANICAKDRWEVSIVLSKITTSRLGILADIADSLSTHYVRMLVWEYAKILDPNVIPDRLVVSQSFKMISFITFNLEQDYPGLKVVKAKDLLPIFHPRYLSSSVSEPSIMMVSDDLTRLDSSPFVKLPLVSTLNKIWVIFNEVQEPNIRPFLNNTDNLLKTSEKAIAYLHESIVPVHKILRLKTGLLKLYRSIRELNIQNIKDEQLWRDSLLHFYIIIHDLILIYYKNKI
jgi:hypothetical protein